MSILETFLLLTTYLEVKGFSCENNASKDFLSKIFEFKESISFKSCPENPKTSLEIYNYFHCQKNTLEKKFLALKKILPLNLNLECLFSKNNILNSDPELLKEQSFFLKEKLIKPNQDGRHIFKDYTCLVFTTWKSQIDGLLSNISYEKETPSELFEFKSAMEKRELEDKFKNFEPYFTYSCSSIFIP